MIEQLGLSVDLRDTILQNVFGGKGLDSNERGRYVMRVGFSELQFAYECTREIE